jgi:hypothetical protein
MKGKLSLNIYSRQAINHFENHNEISNKMNLFKNMKKICADHNQNVFNFMPLTFAYNLDNEEFSRDIGHFIRYFKAVEMFNILKTRPDLKHVPDRDFICLMEKFGEKDAWLKISKKKVGKMENLRQNKELALQENSFSEVFVKNNFNL